MLINILDPVDQEDKSEKINPVNHGREAVAVVENPVNKYISYTRNKICEAWPHSLGI